MLAEFTGLVVFPFTLEEGRVVVVPLAWLDELAALVADVPLSGASLSGVANAWAVPFA
jgi:hypothetical protein